MLLRGVGTLLYPNRINIMKLTHLVLTALLFSTACSDWVDLDPPNDLLTQEAFTTQRELQSALTGVYHLIASVDLAGRNWLLFSDLMAQNAVLSCCDFQEFTQLRISPVNPRVEGLWITSYRAINQLNQLLAAIDDVATADPNFAVAEEEQMRSEAHFLRGVIYYYLVHYFALPYAPETGNEPGVPLVLEPVLATTGFTYPARTSVAEVYAQIERDWVAAYAELPPQPEPGQPGQTAAAGFLAKLAFEQGRLAGADQWSQVVLDSLHQLTATPQEFFRQEGSSEEIWSAAAASENPNFEGLNWAYESGYIHPNLIEQGYQTLLLPRQRAALEQAGYAGIDLRDDARQITADPLVTADLGRSRKYEEPGGSGDDAPLLRLAEILLLRAETVARLGRTTEAIELLNRVRRRAFRVVASNGAMLTDAGPWVDYTPADFPTTDELLDAIVRERRVELAFEGNYLHDLIRLRRDVRPGVAWNDPRLRLPIPQRELDVNPNLVQNPGY